MPAILPLQALRRRVAGAIALALAFTLAQAAQPPQAAQRPHVVASPFGERVDEYHWLRDDDPKAKRPEVLRHLEAENAHTAAVMAPLAPLQKRLFDEMRQRLRADDSTAPAYQHGWWTWRRFEPGNEHPVLMRRRGTPERMDPKAPAEVLLDLPRMAIGQAYFELGAVALSPDGQWLAWTEDTLGRRIWTLRIQHLKTRRAAGRPIEGVLENIAWAADSRTLFYVRQDPVTLQGSAVHRHQRGAPAARDPKVYEERDKTLFLSLRESASRRHVIIDIQGYDTTETRAVPSAEPQREPVLVLARKPGVRALADHVGNRWVFRTNEAAPNFRLVEAPEAAPDDRAGWRDLVPARADAVVEGFALFDRFVAVEERVQAQRRVRVLGSERQPAAALPGPAGDVALGDNLDPRAAHVRVVAQSLVRPPAVVDLHLQSGAEVLRKQDKAGGYDPRLYRSERDWALARDGARIPVTLAWRPDRAARDGRAPLLIEGYGAYGINYDPEFAARRASLLDRGFVVAIAHVRGGSELGHDWYEGGRLMHKQNSFDDFVAVTGHLVREGWGAPDKVFAQGGSAGGLLVGAVANQAGPRYRGIALDVPFVDVVTTMLDPSIPLTANEWSQWGDPREREAYHYLLSYSPYDNIGRRAYPAMLVTTALWDSQVQYWEPVKYVARLRALKADTNPLLLHVEMDAGHGGAAGRFERLRHWARQYAFFIDLAGQAH